MRSTCESEARRQRLPARHTRISCPALSSKARFDNYACQISHVLWLCCQPWRVLYPQSFVKDCPRCFPVAVCLTADDEMQNLLYSESQLYTARLISLTGVSRLGVLTLNQNEHALCCAALECELTLEMRVLARSPTGQFRLLCPVAPHAEHFCGAALSRDFRACANQESLGKGLQILKILSRVTLHLPEKDIPIKPALSAAVSSNAAQAVAPPH